MLHSRTAAPAVRLRGRAGEQRALAALLAEAEAGRGAALLLTGGPGLGRSALLDDACAAAGPLLVLRACGVAPESGLAFAGLQRLLRPVRDSLAGLGAAQAAVLRRALETGRVAESDRFLLCAGFLDLLGLLGAARPLLCAVDDAHLLDGRSLDVLAFAARRTAGLPVAMLFTARDGRPEPVVPGVAALRLPPLTDDAVRELLADAAPGPVAPRVADRLVRAACGNPLAARGFAASLGPERLSGAAPLPEPPRLDDGLREAHAAPVRALPALTRDLLLLAAADPRAGVDALVRAAGPPAVSVSAFEPAEEAGLVRIDGDRLRFREPLLRTAVYQDASAARRRAAHRALAGVVDAAQHPARYVRHRAAGARGPDRALAAELAAVAAAVRRTEGHAAASKALERAAGLTPHPQRRACRLATASHDAWLAGLTDRAEELLARARALAPAGRAAGVVELLHGHAALRAGNALDAADALLAAAALLVDHDRPLAVRALLRAADAASYAGDADRQDTAARLLAPLARPDDDPALRLGCAYLAGYAASSRGDYPASVGPLRRVLALAEEVEDPPELIWACIAALRLGDAPRAHALARRAVAVARRREAAAAVPQALEFLVWAEFWTGRFPSAVESSRLGLRLASETGQPTCATHHLAWLALTAAVQGDAEGCRALARAAAEQAREHSLGLPAALGSWAMALLDLAAGDAAASFFRLRALVRAGPGHGHATMRLLTGPYFVEAAVRTGETARARAALDGYLRWADATGSTAARALAARGRALLAAGAEAEELFEEALRLHRSSGHDGVEEARTRLLYGAALRRSRLPARAREHLRDAVAAFERSGARLWLAQARAELRAIGDLDHRAERPAADGLTPQQRQIALLVARGATNREVAAHMFLSPRTVEYHLRAVFRKLNIRSRVELARLFH
ncbi:helix-turn-helix transcriptional regulator [Allonocardiopsis opalescens]|uniref:AAA ATPase-like protein n=1 Tax=Allonocardiopsis opalescens TaxID=1144618 RepID=A0A2T0PX25_9ACTN|nr:helix-turn-helix transcriptional regulator [Allonocardiopsis opalescens]PRX96085.1 AAA ATPase-like protein [Allonocardiopsis opalescens]